MSERTKRPRTRTASERPRGRVEEPPVFPATLRELIRVEGLLRRLSEPHFARYGVSPAQWGVLRSLIRLEEDGKPQPRMQELGAALLVQPPSLSATLDRMERAALVERRGDDEDQRIRRVSLTPSGREMVLDVLEDHYQWVATVMGGLDLEETATLNRLLRKLGEHMGALAQGPEGSRGRTVPRTRRTS